MATKKQSKYFVHNGYGFVATNGSARKFTLEQVQAMADMNNTNYTAVNCETGVVEHIFTNYRASGRD